MGALDELSAAVAKVAGLAGPGVVGIGGRWRRGSGVIVAENRVLTNAHNVHGDEATCVFADGRRARGRLLGEDMDGDLAVLEVDTAGAAALPWANAKSAPAIGSIVFAVASAAAGGIRTTVGMITGVERSFRGPGGRLIGGSIEHTAPLASGSSGSPVLDGDGRLLGINTQRIGEGFYLALPADESLRARIDALGRGESAVRPRLGIAVAPGRTVFLEGDLIVSAGGAPIEDPDGLHEALAKAGSGKLDVGLVRGVEELTVAVDLGGPVSAGEASGGEASKPN
jgi:serine protease Do